MVLVAVEDDDLISAIFGERCFFSSSYALMVFHLLRSFHMGLMMNEVDPLKIGGFER